MDQIANLQKYIQIFTQLADLGEKYGMPVVNKIIEAAHKPDPTAEDWKGMFAAATPNTDKFLQRINALPAETSITSTVPQT